MLHDLGFTPLEYGLGFDPVPGADRPVSAGTG